MSIEEEILDAPSKEDLRPELEKNLANWGKRFQNFLLDIAFNYFFVLAFIITMRELGFFYLIKNFKEYLFITLYFVYYLGMETFTGKTVGKLITGTKVVTEMGERPDFNTVIIRSLCRLIPFEAFSFLNYFPIGWHDSISGTRVVLEDKKDEL